MKQLALALTMFTLSFVHAAPPSRMDIYEFTKEAIHLDSDYQDAEFDRKITDIKRDAADNLYRGKFSLEPYSDRYKNNSSSYYSDSYIEEGVKAGYTQFLPLGTAITFGYGNTWENTRTTALAPENSYQISLIQPLWRNSFGLGERSLRDGYEAEAEAMSSLASAARNDACGRATKAYVDSYTQEKLGKVIGDLMDLATELHKKSEPSFKSGQIGKLDWWGVQSELLSLQDQKSQSLQRSLEFRLAMNRVAPSTLERELTDPTEAFQKMLGNLKAEQKKGPTFAELYYQRYYEAQKLKAKSERSLSRPNLDLKVTHTNSEGDMRASGTATPYTDRDLAASIEFTWEINDGSVTLKSRAAEVEAERALFKSRELERTRQDRFKQSITGLIRQFEQIEYEKKRTVLLGQITEENKRRFLQGRIDFQDFLRVREQWFETQNRLLEKQATYWKDLATFSLTENLPVPFCQE